MASDTDRIYIEILETVLMATLDPDLWKSALQKLAFLTRSALMELFNVKPAENAVAELLVRGMTPYIWAYLSPRSEPTLRPVPENPYSTSGRAPADSPRNRRRMVSLGQE